MTIHVIFPLILSVPLSKDTFSFCLPARGNDTQHWWLTSLRASERVTIGTNTRLWKWQYKSTHSGPHPPESRLQPWVIRQEYMQIATRMANNWKENKGMAKKTTIQGVNSNNQINTRRYSIIHINHKKLGGKTQQLDMQVLLLQVSELK